MATKKTNKPSKVDVSKTHPKKILDFGEAVEIPGFRLGKTGQPVQVEISDEEIKRYKEAEHKRFINLKKNIEHGRSLFKKDLKKYGLNEYLSSYEEAIAGENYSDEEEIIDTVYYKLERISEDLWNKNDLDKRTEIIESQKNVWWLFHLINGRESDYSDRLKKLAKEAKSKKRSAEKMDTSFNEIIKDVEEKYEKVLEIHKQNNYVESKGKKKKDKAVLEVSEIPVIDGFQHPGPLIEEKVLRFEPSLRQAAKTLDVANSTLVNLFKGRAAFTEDMAVDMEDAYGVSFDKELHMQTDFSKAKARQKRLKRVSAVTPQNTHS